MIASDIEYYTTRDSINNEGIFFYTECGNRMYNINKDRYLYNNKICPKCGKILIIKEEL